MAAIKKSSTGELLRYWRRVRRYSQMDLSLECDTSSRHLSCVETGRGSDSPGKNPDLARALPGNGT